MKTVTCTKCGWVSFGVSREYAEREVSSFIEHYNKLSEKEKEFWGGVTEDGGITPARMPSVEDYKCGLCNGTNFRESIEGDYPAGCTLSPVIIED